jgi:GntR family transcriptional regulator/MocR family aminotransferase
MRSPGVPKQTASVHIPPVSLDSASSVPIYRQLYEGLRAAILSGRLVAGTQLPSTRLMAKELGVSRTTAVYAFEQLADEGYVVSREGSGTRVAGVLPDDSMLTAPATKGGGPGSGNGIARSPARTLSRRSALLTSLKASAAPDVGAPRAFRTGVPALDMFPLTEWQGIAARVYRTLPHSLLGYGDAAGYGPLRVAIAAYLGASRAVNCSPEQVIITTGSQQALDLAARLLLDAGDEAWIEDPGYMGARAALLSAGARLVPVPVDEEGLDVALGAACSPGARVVYVTPSHQYPMGATMSLPRRLALLQWATRAGAWLLEDDYDSEFRYRGRPLPALQGLDTGGRVIYMGTFSKVLFPALRLAYMVVPPDLVQAFTRARDLVDRHPPTIEQAVVTEFITGGHFARHIRRMRALYAERQAVLVDAASDTLAGLLDITPSDAGLHLLGRLPAGYDDTTAARQAAGQGVDAAPLSAYALRELSRGGLVLGYAGVDNLRIREGVSRLAIALGSGATLPG